MNVLIAEDSKELSDLVLRELLRDDRVSAVALANDGRSAIDALIHPDREADGIRFGAVLTDWDLGPGPDGLDIARVAHNVKVPRIILWSAISRTAAIAADARSCPLSILVRTKDDIAAVLEELLS